MSLLCLSVFVFLMLTVLGCLWLSVFFPLVYMCSPASVFSAPPRRSSGCRHCHPQDVLVHLLPCLRGASSAPPIHHSLSINVWLPRMQNWGAGMHNIIPGDSTSRLSRCFRFTAVFRTAPFSFLWATFEIRSVCLIVEYRKGMTLYFCVFRSQVD